MSIPPPPPRGNMVLYDRMDPPLTAGEYTLRVSTDVQLSGAVLPADERQFNVEGPRFALAPTEVSGVYPPRNARGAFSDALPHVTLGRRTLPWERTADPAGVLPLPAAVAGDPPRPSGTLPWLALLLFDETDVPEATVMTNQLVSDVLPAAVRTTLRPPSDARCDAIEMRRSVLRDLLPTVEELHLLTHVRQVNIEDRELSAGDSDGWFSVVVSNRVPQRNHKYRACLVSVEGRSDLLTVTEPPVAPDFVIGPIFVNVLATATAIETPAIAPTSTALGAVAIGGVGRDFVPGVLIDPDLFDPPVRLVLLHSWNFECDGTGTFQQLAENVDTGLIGEVRGEFPRVADTGHIGVELRDRAGSVQTVWYRGPLVPFPVTRDTRGPYHSADQARRVSPETGIEDISYAAAFEVGRLLAAADARLAQELMRWRRGDYRRSVIKSLDDLVRVRFPGLLDRLRLEEVATVLVNHWIDPRVKVVDPYELVSIAGAPGLDPARLADAWSITADRARDVLSPRIVALAPPVERGTLEILGPTTLDELSRDVPVLDRLAHAREQILDVNSRLEREMGGRG